MQVFNVQSVTVTMPEDISPAVVVDFLHENFYGYVVARVVPMQGDTLRDGVYMDAKPHCRLNDVLADLQRAADFLRARTGAKGA